MIGFRPLLAVAALFATTASAQNDPWYRLHPIAAASAAVSLDVGQVQGNAQWYAMLLTTGQATGQAWKMRQQSDSSYRMTNGFQGDGMCLDVAQDGSTGMAPCGNASGQKWRLTSVGGQIFTIGNDYKPGECLDVLNVPNKPNIAYMAACSGSKMQEWLIMPR